jgi:hypothetical protein
LSIWTFTPDNTGSGAWDERYRPTDSIFTNLTRTYGSGFAFTPGAAYILGGYISSWTSPQTANLPSALLVPGLTSFTFKDSSWSNVSSAGYSAFGFANGPGMHFVSSYGKAGVLVILGGDDPTSPNSIAGSALRGMENVTVYDIYNQLWYHQAATGDVPESKFGFCIVGAQGDNNTYEM